MRFVAYIVTALFSFTLVACFEKDVAYNKPAAYWYEGIYSNIKLDNLEKADSYFSSLKGEHANSNLIPEAMMALGRAHLDRSEHVLANFYFSEYMRRYGNQDNYDYVDFLKLKAKYSSFRNISKDQQFMLDAIGQIQAFLEKYPDSRYLPYVYQMEAQFALGLNELNKVISKVYSRNGKEEAAKNYLDRVDDSLEKEVSVVSSKVPWYMWLLNW